MTSIPVPMYVRSLQHRKRTRGAWGQFLAEFLWDWFITLTFRKPIRPESAWNRCVALLNKIQNEANGPIGWFAVEGRGALGGLHIHALLGGVADLVPRRWEKEWFRQAGTAYIVEYDSNRAAAYYCANHLDQDGLEYHLSDNLPLFRKSATRTDNREITSVLRDGFVNASKRKLQVLIQDDDFHKCSSQSITDERQRGTNSSSDSIANGKDSQSGKARGIIGREAASDRCKSSRPVHNADEREQGQLDETQITMVDLNPASHHQVHKCLQEFTLPVQNRADPTGDVRRNDRAPRGKESKECCVNPNPSNIGRIQEGGHLTSDCDSMPAGPAERAKELYQKLREKVGLARKINIEIGRILKEMHEKQLHRYIRKPGSRKGYVDFAEFASEATGWSNGTIWTFIRTCGLTEGANPVPLSDIEQMSGGNAYELTKIPAEKRTPALIQQAKVSPNRKFQVKIREIQNDVVPPEQRKPLYVDFYRKLHSETAQMLEETIQDFCLLPAVRDGDRDKTLQEKAIETLCGAALVFAGSEIRAERQKLGREAFEIPEREEDTTETLEPAVEAGASERLVVRRTSKAVPLEPEVA